MFIEKALVSLNFGAPDWVQFPQHTHLSVAK